MYENPGHVNLANGVLGKHLWFTVVAKSNLDKRVGSPRVE
jgi:hypothetical protein